MISAIAVAQAEAAAAHTRATGWHARSAAFGTEVRPRAVTVLMIILIGELYGRADRC
jgi:hypothetical protein